MYRKQLGRRNLSDEQKTYLLGKLYEARKQTRGGTGANQYNVQNRQNGDSAKGRTVIQIAKEQGVGQKTVERAEHFAKGLDAIREDFKDAAMCFLFLRKLQVDIDLIGFVNQDAVCLMPLDRTERRGA